METFDTCDLQPGINSKHRLQSLPATTAKRRTNYSSFPRITAGFFLAQSIGFFLAAAATAVSGILTRALGAQIFSAAVAGVLLLLTLLLLLSLLRWKGLQVIPDGVLPGVRGEDGRGQLGENDWKPVVIGKPSGKMRRVNVLEMGRWSRWSEIRRLNGLEK